VRRFVPAPGHAHKFHVAFSGTLVKMNGFLASLPLCYKR
jgi:hypothetical protein